MSSSTILLYAKPPTYGVLLAHRREDGDKDNAIAQSPPGVFPWRGCSKWMRIKSKLPALNTKDDSGVASNTLRASALQRLENAAQGLIFN